MIAGLGFSRRSMMKAGAAVAAGLGAAVTSRFDMAQAASSGETGAAKAPEGSPMPAWSRVKLGDALITTVLDGTRAGDGPYPTFGADQSQEAVAALMRENHLPENRFVNMFNPVLIEMGGELILVDTGMGAGARGNGMGFLTERMKEAGYKPDDVSLVILTHFHGDHIGGLMEDGKPAFANARYVAGAKEYEWWTSDEARSGDRAKNAEMVEKNVVPFKDKMTMVKEGDQVIEGITAHEAFGHTPGHMIFAVQSGGKKLWLTGDTANHFVASLQRPDWSVSFDQDKAMAKETRRRVFDMIAEERSPFIGYHMPFPALGYVMKMGEGYHYMPHTYQLLV
ncbi:MBL fold metallo-hydrolase [Consotaella salsifontis]|uniref:Glyoxylase, beta-lactamase superfamily II n=1 Tax=Consotaella salsifontis TaxID=1365950 RepID=A0A1T4SUG7_9HYPH|nr:MBL fold metallo-hydrolase [Consotaella salsifontis]SKA31802.1 Glyoxylase, beta-lactamase superfamily II [Consotaella salsifontis]